MKTCSKCGETKPLDHFHKRKASRDGLTPLCKDCKKAYDADNATRIRETRSAYLVKNRQRIRARHRAWVEANRDHRRDQLRAWREANRDHVAEYSWLDREANPEKYDAWQRAYREANRAQILERGRERYQRNREEMLDRARAYSAANPHVGWTYQYRIRARKAGHEPRIEAFTKADVVARYGDGCAYCDDGDFEHLDHYVPVSKGGPHTLENVRPSCAWCNQSKGDLAPDKWKSEQTAFAELAEDEVEAAIDAEIERWTK